MIYGAAVVVLSEIKYRLILQILLCPYKHFVEFVDSRSRDVAELLAEMTFDPVKINLQHTCQVHGKTTVCVKTTVCFKYRIKSDKDMNTGTGECLTYAGSTLNVKREFALCYSI